MIIKCKQCGLTLAELQHGVAANSLINETDGDDYIPQGFYIISDGSFYNDTMGMIIINKNDLKNSINHTEAFRIQGCCGLDGTNGTNKMCKNHHVVGTEN